MLFEDVANLFAGDKAWQEGGVSSEASCSFRL